MINNLIIKLYIGEQDVVDALASRTQHLYLMSQVHKTTLLSGLIMVLYIVNTGTLYYSI